MHFQRCKYLLKQVYHIAGNIEQDLHQCWGRQLASSARRALSAMRLHTALAFTLVVATTTPTTTTATWAAKSKGDCTDTMFANAYSGIRKQMDACEVASGVPMLVPTKKPLKVKFCTQCPELLALKKSGTLPACNVTTTQNKEIHLQSAFNRLFSECDSGTASDFDDSDADDNGDDSATMPAPTATSSTTTKAPVTSKSPAATVTSTSSGSSSRGQSSASTSGTTAALPSSKPRSAANNDSSSTTQTASAIEGTVHYYPTKL